MVSQTTFARLHENIMNKKKKDQKYSDIENIHIHVY